LYRFQGFTKGIQVRNNKRVGRRITLSIKVGGGTESGVVKEKTDSENVALKTGRCIIDTKTKEETVKKRHTVDPTSKKTKPRRSRRAVLMNPNALNVEEPN